MERKIGGWSPSQLPLNNNRRIVQRHQYGFTQHFLKLGFEVSRPVFSSLFCTSAAGWEFQFQFQFHTHYLCMLVLQAIDTNKLPILCLLSTGKARGAINQSINRRVFEFATQHNNDGSPLSSDVLFVHLFVGVFFEKSHSTTTLAIGDGFGSGGDSSSPAEQSRKETRDSSRH